MKRKIFLCVIFFLFSPLVLGFSLFLTNSAFVFPWFNQAKPRVGYTQVLGESTQRLLADFPKNDKAIASVIRANDSTPIIIENYLRHFNSPLLPYKDKILTEAKEHGVKPQLIIAIAQQESNLGKKSPENCFNAWGWAIHEKGTRCFSDWNEAIAVVTEGIAEGYCTQGLCDDPCEMMKKYTPKSNGSWCLAIKEFLSEMESGIF